MKWFNSDIKFLRDNYGDALVEIKTYEHIAEGGSTDIGYLKTLVIGW